MSWERLQLCAAAGRRKEARMILDLGQLIAAGISASTGGNDAYTEKQKQLIEQLKIGLEA